MRTTWSGLAMLGVCSLIFAACDDSESDKTPIDQLPEEIPGDAWPEVPRSEDGPGAGGSGFAFGSAARPAGEARAGQHPESPALFGGGDARCRPGDLVLENDHLRTCISGPISGDAFFVTGGYIVDMVPTANPDHDELETIATVLGLRVASGDDVRVVNDGSDGSAAVVRVSGVDVPLKLMVGTLGSDLLASPINVKTEIEYRLAPDARYLEIVTWVVLDHTRAVSVQAGTVALLGDLVKSWVTGIGEGRPAAHYDYMALIGSEHTWAYLGPENAPMGGMELLSDSLYLEYNSKGRIGNRSDMVFKRYMTVVEGGSSDDIEAAFGDLRAASNAQALAVSFSAQSSIGWESPVWSIEKIGGEGGDEAVGFIRFSEGALTREFSLEAGDYRAVPIGWPTGAPSTLEFSVSAAGQSVTLPRPALRPVSVRIEDAEGEPISALIRYWDDEGGFAHIYHVPGFVDQIPVIEDGPFRVEISAGEARAMVLQDHTTSSTTIAATLDQRMDMQGWIAVDFHQHSQRSADTSTANVDRIFGNLANGLDVIVPTDHDVVENYPAIVERMGLSDKLHVFNGNEVSPILGHFNVFPIRYNPELDAFGAGQLAERTGTRTFRQRTPNEIAAQLLGEGAQLVQLNHGRGATSSLMDHVGYDHVTDSPTRNEQNWLTHFDTMELFNRSKVFCWLFRDWQAMLQHDKRITAVSNSDTHTFVDVGYPRNYVYLGENAANLSDQAIVDALRTMAVSVSGGVLVRFDEEMAGSVISASSPMTIDVRIEVPDWAFADTATVFLNGVPIQEETLDLDGSDPARRSTVLSIELDALDSDATLTVLAWSNRQIERVIPGKRPWGLTNPLYLDVDGGGWSGGGSAAAALTRVPQGISFCTENPVEDKRAATPDAHVHDDDSEVYGRTPGFRYAQRETSEEGAHADADAHGHAHD